MEDIKNMVIALPNDEIIIDIKIPDNLVDYSQEEMDGIKDGIKLVLLSVWESLLLM